MAIVIPYTKQTWVDNNVANPVSAARMGVLEEGILDVSLAPCARVTHNAAQSITNNTVTALAFNTERFDQAGGSSSTQHDTVTNNSRLTAVYAGVYTIFGNIEWAGNATGFRDLELRINGTTVIAFWRSQPATSGTWQQNISSIYNFAVNDYVELLVRQDSGGALNVNSTGNYSPEFGFVRVG